MSPDIASRIKAEVSHRALAMVERDIAVLAEQTIGRPRSSAGYELWISWSH